MDLDDFRTVLESSGVDVWTFIDTAITVASLDYGGQLKHRRDGIVERLYAATTDPRCRTCDGDGLGANGRVVKDLIEKGNSPEGKAASPSTPQSVDEELDPFGGLFDDEQTKIIEIKEQLEDPDQSEDAVVELLQSLADMDITFKALKETDIGRHVNRLRKHSSGDVRRLVKQLVRKWKEIVDEWVKLNQPGELASSAFMADGDSPPPKITRNGHHQVPEFAYSPNPQNGSSGSDKNNSEPEPKPKVIPQKEALPQTVQSNRTPNSAPPNRQREQKETNFDMQRLASARKRLRESYKEAENAKKQRTIQVMGIHEIPKSKNTFSAKNKGSGSHSQGRHW